MVIYEIPAFYENDIKNFRSYPHFHFQLPGHVLPAGSPPHACGAAPSVEVLLARAPDWLQEAAGVHRRHLELRHADF